MFLFKYAYNINNWVYDTEVDVLRRNLVQIAFV